MSILKDKLREGAPDGVSFEQSDVATLEQLELETMDILEVLSYEDNKSFRASLESLPQEVLLGITLPSGVSVESLQDDKKMRELLMVALEEKKNIFNRVLERAKAAGKSVKHVFMSYKSILKELDGFEFDTISDTSYLAKYFTNNFPSFIAAGDKTTAEVLKHIMKYKNSDTLLDFLSLFELTADDKFKKLSPEDAEKELLKLTSKFKSYEEITKALVSSHNLHQETKHIKEYRKAMLAGDLDTFIIKPYPGTATVFSIGNHNETSIFNKMTGRRILMRYSLLRIDDEQLVCEGAEITYKDYQAMLKYTEKEVNALLNAVVGFYTNISHFQIATVFSTKGKLLITLRYALMNVALDYKQYSDAHIVILKKIQLDAKTGV